MELNYEQIGNRIKEIRIAKKWTQARLAEESGVEPSYISHIERGVTKLSLPTLICVANALGATLDEIVYDSLIKSEHISVQAMNTVLSDCNPQEIKALTEVIKTVKRVLREK